ncbi:Uncharacterized protein Fot_16684 [Forsythia ovata]|uniref:Ribosomal protein S7 n=1 Tax=Forsythia ovata TaxID=205694 RepID=A0ABD1VFB9_9LAMI
MKSDGTALHKTGIGLKILCGFQLGIKRFKTERKIYSEERVLRPDLLSQKGGKRMHVFISIVSSAKEQGTENKHIVSRIASRIRTSVEREEKKQVKKSVIARKRFREKLNKS